MVRVITFSINISAGHRRAAEAVARAIMACAPGSEIVERDSMTLLGSTGRRFLTDTYLGIIRHKPDFWNFLYHNRGLKRPMSRIWRFFLSRARERFEAEIAAHAPDVIICTQAIPARIIADLRAQGRCAAPLLAVATDYGIHPYWADEAIDAYAVPCEAAVEELVRDGVRRDRVHVTGIPVDMSFENAPTRETARRRLGLPSGARIVLAMGGGNGLGITPGDVAAIERSPGVDGVVIIAGCNADLASRVGSLPSRPGVMRRVLPTVENIQDYYAAADVLVSKPGGLTMSEATAMGMPILMISPLPGQEVRNAAFLERAGAAIAIEDETILSRRLAEILADGGRIGELKSASLRVGRAGASRRIAGLALALAHGAASSDRLCVNA